MRVVQLAQAMRERAALEDGLTRKLEYWRVGRLLAYLLPWLVVVRDGRKDVGGARALVRRRGRVAEYKDKVLEAILFKKIALTRPASKLIQLL